MKRLPNVVKGLVIKARDSALLAVETYNRPTANFRSGAFIVLMIIAWTSLFHAVFISKRVKPHYRKGPRRYERADGDYRWWELSECLKQYHKSENPAVRKNLEFFIALRNKVEHRSLPQLDTDIFGECQAMLINFESFLCCCFGDRYALTTGLSFALQFSRNAPKPLTVSSARKEDKSLAAVKQFIDRFRSSLSTELTSDLTYSFKVFLMPKIGNHNTTDAVAVEWIKYDPSKPDEMKEYEKIVTLIKPREVRVANLDLMKPGEVVNKVRTRLGKGFNMHNHVICYRHFNARPGKSASDPKACDTRYSVYDAAHRDYLYTQEWVDHLVKSLSNQANYDFLVLGKSTNNQLTATESGAAA